MRLASLIGGPLGDRIGRRKIIWFSILGALPFTLALPYVDLFWTGVLTVVIAPDHGERVRAPSWSMPWICCPAAWGIVAGLFYGLTFGLGGISAALLGEARRPHQHRDGLSDLRVPAARRPRRLGAARHRSAADGLSAGRIRSIQSTQRRSANVGLLVVIRASRS